ncbi:CPBP family intramembrane glutamic endopeptidase [Pseudarthrobacter sulfonivorans]|uniref:CPBP family intramembrane glutamic endopeptidase n=1 Tax=Pseudarthrobacter sulfonivorans TaxID=121292 RepID=UPI002860D9C9|nr:CPBP family intramembrane glutamic endopeptidase [Pseudarthrobacter sulfonivorans]MDR6415733.1 membrane protease YdiL (CAAX protease family) [Pseudarthrobacter sulfonivorans]
MNTIDHTDRGMGQDTDRGVEAGPDHAPVAAGPHAKDITLKQGFRALVFLGLYFAVLGGGLLAVGLLRLVDFTATSLILAVLVGATTAAILALYVHLIRKYGLSFRDVGFRRLSPRMFHLLWQVPVAIIASACVQGLALAAFGQFGMDTSEAGASNSPLAAVAGMPAPYMLLAIVLAVVLTPLWEEVLFRGALLSGFLLRFGPFLAIVLSAAVFASVHLALLTFPYLFSLGIALALLRRFHRNLWAPVVLHAVNNGIVAMVALTAL